MIKAVKPEKEECLGIWGWAGEAGKQESRKGEDLSGGSGGSRWCEVVVMAETIRTCTKDSQSRWPQSSYSSAQAKLP